MDSHRIYQIYPFYVHFRALLVMGTYLRFGSIVYDNRLVIELRMLGLAILDFSR